MSKFKRIFTDRTMLVMFLYGFAAGLPFTVIRGSVLQAWAYESGLDLGKVGLLALVGLPYSLKVFWSPLLDWYVPPFMGRRRGWIALTQIGLVLALVVLALTNPSGQTSVFVAAAVLVAFMSATQDIGIDAHRRESLPINSFGFGNSLYITGYRMAMLLIGALALALAQLVSWRFSILCIAAVMGVGLVATWIAREPVLEFSPPKSFREAVVDPFIDFFKRKEALWILAFLLLYKLGENLAVSITTPFYLDAGYSKIEIASIAKIFGVWAVIVGGLIGGAIMVYIGLRRALLIFGVLQAVAILGFAGLGWLAPLGVNRLALILVITCENLSIGMGTAAYSAFMANVTNKRFTATQYALLTSFMALPRDLIASGAGFLAQRLDYPLYFIFCAFVGIPGLLLVLKISRWAEEDPASFPGAAVEEVLIGLAPSIPNRDGIK